MKDEQWWNYRAFSDDVTAGILEYKTMKRQPCWCPCGAEPFSCVNFFTINLYRCWSCE